MSEFVITYCGKTADEYTKDELMDIVCRLSAEVSVYRTASAEMRKLETLRLLDGEETQVQRLFWF